MKRIFFSLLFFCLLYLYMLLCRKEAVSLNTPTGTIYGRLILPDDKASFSVVVLLIAGSGPTDMDGNTTMGNIKNNSLKYLAEGLAENGIPSFAFRQARCSIQCCGRFTGIRTSFRTLYCRCEGVDRFPFC